MKFHTGGFNHFYTLFFSIPSEWCKNAKKIFFCRSSKCVNFHTFFSYLTTPLTLKYFICLSRIRVKKRMNKVPNAFRYLDKLNKSFFILENIFSCYFDYTNIFLSMILMSSNKQDCTRTFCLQKHIKFESMSIKQKLLTSKN